MAKEEQEFEQEEALDAMFTPIDDEVTEEQTETPPPKEAEKPEDQEKKPGLFERLEEQKEKRKAERERRKQERAEEKARRLQLKAERKAERKRKWEAGRKRRRRIAAVIGTILVLLLIAGGAIYYRYVQYFGSHFYKGTLINGTDVSYQTVEDVKKGIEERVAAYTLTIKTKNGSETLDARAVGWQYVDDQKVDELMMAQDPWLWIARVSERKQYQISAGTTYDRKKTDAAIASLKCLNREITEPVDAALLESTSGVYEITPETEGNRVDEEKLKKAIHQALDASESMIDIVQDDCYVHPAVYRDDPKLIARRDAWNRYLSLSISYKFGAETETINANDVKRYLRDNGEEVTLAQDWISMLIWQWSWKYDTFGVARSVRIHDGTERMIPAGGDYGWALNREKMIEDLRGAIEQGESGAREPIWLFRAKGWDNGDLTGNYIEIDRELQKLYLYQDGQVVLETDVVTGRPGADTAAGIYAIDEKKEQAVLDREETEGQEEPVAYWCAFNGKQGICDAAWRTVFGGEEYQTNGSSGMVYVPSDRMERIYEGIEEGCAVVIY